MPLGTGNPSYKHARHISSLMREPLIEPPVEDHTPTANKASQSSVEVSELPRADEISPVRAVRYKNLSARLSKPFTFLNQEELDKTPVVSLKEKSVHSISVITAAVEEFGRRNHESKKPEWIPPMLRWRFSFLLCSVLVISIVVLEIFDILDRKRNGFAVGSNVRGLATYFPTVLVVVLACVWDMVLKNLKEVGPWALMARGWTRAEDGLYSVNYIDALDIRGFLLSIKMRQFGISLGYVGAVLCGALVPFANNLFFTDPVPRLTTTPQSMVRTSELLVNDGLTGNGGVTLNSSMFDPQAFLSYLATKRGRAEFPDWTMQQHAFDSFNLTGKGVSADLLISDDVNITITTTVGAFGINTTCDPISWTFYDGQAVRGTAATDIRLVPDSGNLQKAGCIIRPEDYPRLSLEADSVAAWFNYTTCGTYQCPSSWVNGSSTLRNNCGEAAQSDLRLTMNLWNPAIYAGNISALSNSSAKVAGLLCKVGMYRDKYEIQVDARTMRLVGVGSKPVSSRSVSIKNPESIVLKINQFLKTSSGGSATPGSDTDYRFPQEAFLDDPAPAVVRAGAGEYFDNGEVGYFPGAIRPGSDPLNSLGVDRFILMMSQGNRLRIANYADNMSQMQEDMTNLLQHLVSQIVNLEYRKEDARALKGQVTISAKVIRIRPASLRVLQVSLALVALATILTSTKYRPKTHLRSDPRSLGATGILLARSEQVETFLQDTGDMSEREFLQHLRRQYLRTTVEHDHTVLELQDSCQFAKMMLRVPRRRNHNARPYRPFNLRPMYIASLLAAAAVIMIGLGISWWRNDQMSGYAATNRDGTYAIIFFPAAVLVFLGYAAQAVDSAIQSSRIYVELSERPLAARTGLGFNPARYSFFTLGYRSLKQSRDLRVLFTSLGRFLVPGMKIAVAGLFFTELQPSITRTLLPLEASLVGNLNTYNLTTFNNSDDHEKLLRARAMTLLQLPPEEQAKMNPVGLIDGLVFSNITNRLSNQEIDAILDTGVDANLRIPAIQVTPVCETFGTTDYASFTPFEDGKGNPNVKIVCRRGAGLERCPSQTLDKVFTSSSTGTSSNGTAFFWNRELLVSSHDPVDAPVSPEFDGAGDLQNVTTFMLAKTNFADPGSTPLEYEITGMASFWCNLNYTPVLVNVTVNRPRRATLGRRDTLPLTIRSYDASSITTILALPAYDVSHLNWTNINGLASVHSVHPLEGRNVLYNIMRQQNPNVTDEQFVMSPELLGQAGGRVLMQFASQMIDLARPFVDPMTAAQSEAMVMDAQVVATRPRLIQRTDTTVALEVLLAGLLAWVATQALWAQTKLTTRAALMKAPNSVGAQAGLMAGSELVKMAREEMQRRRTFGEYGDSDDARRNNHDDHDDDDALWDVWLGHQVSLGWWERPQSRSPNLARSEIEIDTWIRGGEVDRGEKKFGVDAGEAAARPL